MRLHLLLASSLPLLVLAACAIDEGDPPPVSAQVDAGEGDDIGADASEDADAGGGEDTSSITKTPDLSEPVAGDPALYDYTLPATWLYTIAFSLSGEKGLDLDDDGVPDNALGELLASVNAITQEDVNARLQDNIDAGSFSIGFAWLDRDDAPLDNGLVELHVLNLDLDPSHTRATIERDSFPNGYRTPTVRFVGELEGSALAVGPAPLSVLLPLNGSPLRVRLDRVLVRGLAELGVSDSAGIRVSNGVIGGVVALRSLADGLNQYTAPQGECACLGLNRPLIELSSDLTPEACTPVPATSTCESGDPCDLIATLCPSLITVVRDKADFDIDGDGEYDALSAALSFEGAPVVLDGVAPEP